MKKLLTLTFAFISLFVFSDLASAQGRTVEPQIQRDPILEQDALKNLEIARGYFVTKKAYRAVLMRLDEVIAAHPEFSRMDEVLYLSGLSSWYLAEGKGKQKIDVARLNEEDKKRYAPDRLREDAVANLSLLVQKFPESEFRERAEKTLREIDPKTARK
jgi:outer membrane protein assembly factor BamD (BamD/ComL family)